VKLNFLGRFILNSDEEIKDDRQISAALDTNFFVIVSISGIFYLQDGVRQLKGRTDHGVVDVSIN